MKRFVLICIFLGALFVAAYFLGKSGRLREMVRGDSGPEVLDCGFRAAEYCLEEKPFVVVMIGRDHGAFVERALRSVFSQKYSNYRFVYVDDGSTDGSFALAEDLVASSGLKELATLIRHEEPLGELANLWAAVKEASDHEIVVWLDGKGWLAHEWTLSRLNSYYADPDLWLTFGQYREFPDYRLGMASPYSYQEWKENGFRQSAFTASHVKTFYAGLFKHIDPEDLMYQSAFLPAAADVAVMIPLLELAQDHFQFIPEILYIAYRQASLGEQELLMKTERYIRSLSSYEPITHFMQTEAALE